MKKMLLIALIGTLALTGSLWAMPEDSDVDLVVLGTLYVPENDDLYEQGQGAEVQLRYWLNQTFGLALAGGWSRWEVDDSLTVSGDGRFLGGGNIDEDIDFVPVGASLLIRAFNTDRLSLVLEGGARYVFVDDSGANVEIATATPGGVITTREKIKMDDGLIAVAAAHLEFEVGEDFYILAGEGYQWDLDEGDIEALDEDIEDNQLEALLVQVGFGFRF